MTSLLLERAWVDGAVQDDVLVEIEDGRFTAVTPGAQAGGTPRRAHRSRASRTATATRSTGPCGAATQRERGSFWTWRDQMYDVAGRLDPDGYLDPGAGHLPRDGRGRDHRVSASSTTSTTSPTGRRTTTPTRWASPSSRRPARRGSGSPCWTRATSARGSASRPRGCRSGTPTGTRPPGRTRVDAARTADRRRSSSVRRRTPSARCRPSSCRPWPSWAGGDEAPARPPLRAGGGEPGLRGGVLPHARRGARAPRRPRPDDQRDPRHPPDRGRHQAARQHRHPRLLLPHHRARPRRRRRSEPETPRGRGPAHPRQRQPCRDRPLRGDARGRARRAAGHPAARALERRRAPRRRHVTGHASLGWDDAGAIAVGRRADLVTIDPTSPRTAGTGRDESTVVFAATAEDVTQVMVDGRIVVRQGDRDEIGRELDAAIGRIWQMTSTLIHHIGELVTNDPAARRPARHRRGRRARDRGRHRRLGGPRGGRARRPTRRTTPGGAPCSPASSTATATWSSPATGRGSSRPGWPASPTPRAASAPPSPPPARRPTSSSPATSPGWCRR